MDIFKTLLIFILSFQIINNRCSSEGNESIYDMTASINSCQSRTFSYDEVLEGVYKCCYLEMNCPDESGTMVEIRRCQPLKEEEYMGHRKKRLKEKIKCIGVVLECKSSYLSIGFIYLILLITL